MAEDTSALRAILLATDRGMLAERTRWPLWIPVFLGIGIGGYFSLPIEPPLWLAGLGLALAAGFLALALARRRLVAVMSASVLLALAVGFFAAQVRTALVAAPVIERASGALMLEGRVVEVERLPEGALRVTFDRLVLEREEPILVPERVRLRLKPGFPPFAVGDRLRMRAMLMPPPHPSLPGAFDFARFSWFKRLGAIGTALGQPEIVAAAEPSSRGFSVAVNDLRHRLTERIVAVLSGDRGAVAAALITGDQMPISAPMMQAYRDSGLAHILSISGLHISLAAGLVFVGLRALLALIPPLALRYPIKKWAAALAILFAWGYTLLAGSPVPAQRSFLMIALVLLAVLLDRTALTMRPVALAAALVLLIEPEELIGPSFQMSFAAVIALIAWYETQTPRQAAWRAAHPGLLAGIGLYVAGIALTTLIAGSVTAIFAIYHFNRFAVWSVLANMLAVPLTGFWVMPWALVLFLLLPFGLEAVALVPMGWGVEAVNQVAIWVAGWPGAAVTTPTLSMTGLVAFTLGGCWLCLWTKRWRWWGLVPMVLGMASLVLADPPDLLVDGRGAAMAVRTADGYLLLNGKGGRILKETWSRRAGPEAPERWPRQSNSRDGRLRCDPVGCLWRAEGRVVALIRDETAIETACAGAGIVVSAVPLRGTCRGATLVIDRFDLWRRGAHAVWLRPGGVQVETVAEAQGNRPWAWHPHPRRRKTAAAPVPSSPAEAVDTEVVDEE
ncbi:ComEC/Rec2 family competence protein [Magnetospirillum molischianum]|uniref:Predicted membrane metal-binding protein n=1 Tax=Magnetospirillum molischianum DSM 120 TaxID=1150626 RepID=H8FSU8_MAGML|nr:ComEC/Rec2 family competence protein [Magnetospirillum molischianum]CCG41436.1 Predicted membrane metal-binding protein [Magnetospirillum molischianum DSM 120]